MAQSTQRVTFNLQLNKRSLAPILVTKQALVVYRYARLRISEQKISGIPVSVQEDLVKRRDSCASYRS